MVGQGSQVRAGKDDRDSHGAGCRVRRVRSSHGGRDGREPVGPRVDAAAYRAEGAGAGIASRRNRLSPIDGVREIPGGGGCWFRRRRGAKDLMQIVVPMAGAGTRFVQAGYTSPKPLIEVDGMPVIEHVIRLFPGERQFLFVCARNHLEETPWRSVLRRLAPSARIVGIEPHKRGPVHTALEAREFISDEEPVVLNYCDFSVYWSYARFKQQMEELTCAGCITAYRGFHPHSLGSNLYAYLREHNRFLTEIQEKRCFTDQRMNEYASAGTYYFRSGALLKRYFQRAIERDLQTNGEYYASMPYNLMVEDGLDVYVYELEHFLQWGTPEDLEEYRAWSGYFAGYADWKPSLPPMAGTNLIAMAGSGMRFEREGYGQPKPFVPVAGMPMVRRALRTVPPAKAWIAACRPEHLGTPAFDEADHRHP